MLFYRTGPEGFYAAGVPGIGVPPAGIPAGEPRVLFSDPLETHPADWRFGRKVDLTVQPLLPPVVPGKIVGIGRNYAAHARELGNEPPAEPVIFLKAPSSLVGPAVPIVLPPESERVEFEGEIAVVVGRRLCRADAATARVSVLGVTCACDVTARDLQRRDPTFARAKSFDTFCPVGPAVLVGADLDDLAVTTRLNGEVRQEGHVREMLFPIPELLAYVSRMMTLEPGDLVLTGTPAGVGPLADGDRIEVEVSGVGILSNPVESWRQS